MLPKVGLSILVALVGPGGCRPRGALWYRLDRSMQPSRLLGERLLDIRTGHSSRQALREERFGQQQ
ncbi:MAG: hypothetical protein SNJ82_13190 [Gemmataceae bacterium]